MSRFPSPVPRRSSETQKFIDVHPIPQNIRGQNTLKHLSLNSQPLQTFLIVRRCTLLSGVGFEAFRNDGLLRFGQRPLDKLNIDHRCQLSGLAGARQGSPATATVSYAQSSCPIRCSRKWANR